MKPAVCFIFARRTLFLAAILGCAAAAAQPPKPVHKAGVALGTPAYRALTVEMVYTYSVTPYAPALRVVPVEPALASYATPEDALIANLSSLAAANFAWNNQTWTVPSVQEMEKRDKEQGETAAKWEARWKTLYVGKRFELLNRIDYSKYVLIEYRVTAQAGGAPIVDTASLVKEGGLWKLTQELAADPILVHWNSPQRRVQVAPASLFSK